MAPNEKNRPTAAELRILKILWRHGPSTAREVMERLTTDRKIGYTTVLKMLQLMEPKGMVAVDRSARSHVYRARWKKEATLKGLAREFVDRAFDGAVEEALVHLVEGKKLDREALTRLEKRLAELKREEAERD